MMKIIGGKTMTCNFGRKPRRPNEKSNTCKNCQFFERGKWHKSIDNNETERLGGQCKMILNVLQIENSWLWNKDYISVQDSFGCSLFKGE